MAYRSLLPAPFASLLATGLRGACLLAACGLVSACTDDRGGGKADMAQLPGADLSTPTGPGCAVAGSRHQLSNLTGQHAYPRIATNGSGYVVSWLSGIPGAPPSFRIDATLTDKEGNKLGPNLPLSAQPVAADDPPSMSPITGGTSIAWTRRAGAATDIVLSTIDSSGQKLDASGIACDPSNSNCGILPLTSSGVARSPFLERPFQDRHISGPTENQLGLIFVDSRNYPCAATPCPEGNDIFWKRVQTNGAELLFEKKITNTLNARFASPRLAFDGFRQGAVWRDVTAGTISDLYFTTIDNLGQSTTPSMKIGSASGANAPSTPDIVWSGAEYALVSATGTDSTAAVLYQRQSTSGSSTLSPRGVTFGGSACAPSLAFDGASYGVAYQLDCGKPASDLAFVRIDASGTRYKTDGTSCGDSVDPTCGQIIVSGNERLGGASRPEMVYGGNGDFAVVWMEGPGGANLQPNVPLDVFFQRVHCQ